MRVCREPQFVSSRNKASNVRAKSPQKSHRASLALSFHMKRVLTLTLSKKKKKKVYDRILGILALTVVSRLP